MTSNDIQRKNKRTAQIVILVVAAMIGLSFAFVPLYRLFCQVTGFGGTTQIGGQAPGKVSDRVVTISFDANTDSGLPWDFRPEQKKMDVYVGQQALVNFEGRNLSARQTAGSALYNVTPEIAARYFHKTQCFCFARQEIGPGKTAQFPVMFYLDPAFLTDPEMKGVTDITLSYTFYPADSAALDNAIEQYGEQK